MKTILSIMKWASICAAVLVLGFIVGVVFLSLDSYSAPLRAPMLMGLIGFAIGITFNRKK